MTGEKEAGGIKALVEFKDILGISAAAKILAEGIVQGIGTLGTLFIRPKQDRIDRERFSELAKLLNANGIPIGHIDGELGERAIVRLTADTLRHQQNRERVALAAVSDWMESNGANQSDAAPGQHSDPWSLDWLDRFWRLAECSNEERMQSLWGRVLSRRSTGRLGPSPRVLEYVSLLSAEEIAEIERVAPFVLRSIRSNGTPNCGIINSISPLSSIGSNLDRKIIDSENTTIGEIVGNIRSDMLGPTGFFIQSGWAHGFIFPYERGAYQFELSGQKYKLIGPQLREHAQLCTGVGLSPLGDQIVRLVSYESNKEFLDTFAAAWAKLGYHLDLA